MFGKIVYKDVQNAPYTVNRITRITPYLGGVNFGPLEKCTGYHLTIKRHYGQMVWIFIIQPML